MSRPADDPPGSATTIGLAPGGGAGGGPLPAAIGRYRVAGRLGRGGQSEIYRAVHPSLTGRDVVIKWSRQAAGPPLRDRFLDEARALSRLDDPGIVRVFDADAHEGRPFLVFEYIDGQTLEGWCRAQVAPGADEVAALFAELAEVVERIHGRGVLHLDPKPGNVMLDADGRVRELDFGIAALALPWESAEPAGPGISGTPAYMAPEQARGEVERIGRHTDVYGLGGVLYFLLTGHAPRESGDRLGLLEAAREGRITPLRGHESGVTRDLERICLKCLSAGIEGRYARAAEPARRARRFLGRRRRRAALAGGCVAALAPGAWLVRPTDRAAAPSVPMPPAPASASVVLDGELSIRVVRTAGGKVRVLTLGEPGDQVVRDGDLVHLEARLNQPAHVFPVWIDGKGEVQPLYPWDPAHGFSAPAGDRGESPRARVESPPRVDEGWPVRGPAGVESALLLARKRPLPETLDLAALLGRLPEAPAAELAGRQVWTVTPEAAEPRLLEVASRGIGGEDAPETLTALNNLGVVPHRGHKLEEARSALERCWALGEKRFGADHPDSTRRTGAVDLGAGIVTAEDVAELDLSACELAVLSGCETGLGRVGGGEGVIGLARGFHKAGARAVVGSLWRVGDAATAALLREFYGNFWGRRPPKLEAMRQAQLALLAHPERIARVERELAARRPGGEAPFRRGLDVGGAQALPKVAETRTRRSHPALGAAFVPSGSPR